MKKGFLRYRLQPLLEMKLRAKRKSEIRLAKAIARLEEAKKKLKKLEEEKEEIIRRRKEYRREIHEKMASGEGVAVDGHRRMAYLRKMEDDEKDKDEEIKRQKEHIEDCETEVKRAKRAYIDAVKELRIVEKHKELWKKKVDKELSKIEEREMDELGNVIHQLKSFEA